MFDKLKSYFWGRVVPPPRLIIGIVILSNLGLIDAVYLTVVHYSGSNLTCSVFNGCDRVLGSPYAEIYGVPLSLLGVLYYLSVTVLALTFRRFRLKGCRLLLFLLTLSGFLFSLYLVGLQFVVLNALCLFCLFSAFISTSLLVLSGWLLKKSRS